MSTKLDSRAARRYLLGDLREDELNSFELSYFADPEVFEQACAAENELVDDYAAGRLQGEERRLFEQNYLASPLHQERAAAAGALRRVAAPPPPPVRRGPATGLSLALAAGLVVALMAFWVLRPRISGQSVKAPPPTPRITSQPAETPPTVVAAYALSPLLLRGAPGQALSVPAEADAVVLHLEGKGAGGPLRFSLRTVEGEAAGAGPADPPAPAPAGPERLASVRLPAAGLPAGDYILTLSPAAGGEAVHQYFFRVSSARR